MARTVIYGIRTLYGLDMHGSVLQKGSEMAAVSRMHGAWLAIDNQHISGFGSMDTMPAHADHFVDAEGGLVMPCWCDSHTHIVFAAGREQEFVDRLKGASYEEIAANGGGILNSAVKLRSATEEQLFEGAHKRLYDIMCTGTGAVEVKSGYGLTTESELKMLRVVRKLKETAPAMIKATFLGAHAIPAEYKNNRNAYLLLLENEMLPRVAGEGLADYMDVFCDQGFFTPAETDRLLRAAAKFGLPAKIHANELANSGGVQTGIANQAISVDHLEMIGHAEIEALSTSQTIPTILPSCSFFLRIPYAPARQMIDAGLGVAMATDFNPGTSPSGNVPLLLSIACTQMKLLPSEAFTAVTINGACAMQVEKEAGSIAVGKRANLILTKPIPSLEYMVYSFGSDHIAQVWVNGQKIR
jgi:imidazolonepropionase